MMKRENKNWLASIGVVGLAIACGGPAWAGGLLDPDGPGGLDPIANVERLGMTGAIYNDGSVKSVLSFAGAFIPQGIPAGTQIPFPSYFQAKVDSVQTPDGIIPLTQGEITMVGSFMLQPTADTTETLAAFELLDTGDFLEVYYDPTPDVDPTAGTGYNNGQLIMRGGFLSGTNEFMANPAAQRDLDEHVVDGNQYPGIRAVTGNGITDLGRAQATFADSDFFVSGFEPLISVDVDYQTWFDLINPSDAFVTQPNPGFGDGPAPVSFNIGSGDPTGIGPLNGTGGEDLMFQVSPQIIFNPVVPEPTAAILFTGLVGGLAIMRRRA